MRLLVEVEGRDYLVRVLDDPVEWYSLLRKHGVIRDDFELVMSLRRATFELLEENIIEPKIPPKDVPINARAQLVSAVLNQIGKEEDRGMQDQYEHTVAQYRRMKTEVNQIA